MSESIVRFAEVNGEYAKVGLPESEADSVMVFSLFSDFNGPVTLVVDPDTAHLFALACQSEDETTAPLHADVIRYVRPGWPQHWTDPADSRQWLTIPKGEH